MEHARRYRPPSKLWTLLKAGDLRHMPVRVLAYCAENALVGPGDVLEYRGGNAKIADDLGLTLQTVVNAFRDLKREELVDSFKRGKAPAVRRLVEADS